MLVCDKALCDVGVGVDGLGFGVFSGFGEDMGESFKAVGEGWD